MKKNKIVIFANWILLFSLPVIVMTSNIKTDNVKSNQETKNLATSFFSKVEEKKGRLEVAETDAKLQEEEQQQEEEKETKVKKEEIKVQEKVEEPVKSVEVVKEEPKSDVLTTYNGSMSFYYADCRGCTGYTKVGGIDVRDGKIYYSDKQYGNVRIIAAGPEINDWSIVRIKNSSLGNNILGIVLDRGSGIGVGRSHLIDVLTNNDESRGGVSRNVTVEVLRNGR